MKNQIKNTHVDESSVKNVNTNTAEIFEKGFEIMSKRKIDERQANGESVNISEILDETDEIGKMLESSMGTERFNKALKSIQN